MKKLLPIILCLLLAGSVNAGQLKVLQPYLWSCSEFREDFTGSDGNALNSQYWALNQEDVSGSFRIYSNQLYFNVTSASGDKHGWYISEWQLNGDFDIQIDFSLTTFPTPSASTNRGAWLAVNDGVTYVMVLRIIDSAGNSGYAYEGTSDTYAQFVQADSSGKLRLTKTSGTIKAYEWDSGDARWEWNGSTDGYTFTTTISGSPYVHIRAKVEDGSSVQSNMDNFVINSGNCVP